ncbi:Peroxisomal membrane protein MPV17 [Quillaja saponaria]|uniref:Peroxisomal membrane protein MPV17 n=1 Tax=Quillaja saponaria TaxID=32244 RepID=A0AAD7KYR5_QUISA|nr:Peroxisomal membrane protein MPV17 [Quillaja saponaria]
MDAIGGGQWGLWNWNSLPWESKPSRRQRRRGSGSDSESLGSVDATNYRFPFKQAVTAGSLALTGDTIAQLSDRFRKAKTNKVDDSDGYGKDMMWNLLSDHDWLRALRMTSYGFLLYGPGSYAWYQNLDQMLPKPTVQNLMLKVLLNQIVLGPSVITVIFAWNNLWQGKLSQLPDKYKNDALPTLLYGFRFWIPVSVLNFWVVPLQARVAFMSMGSIFWNFCLSSTMSK